MQRNIVVRVTSDFTRAFRCLPKHLQRIAERKDQRFRGSPFHPGLRTHQLKGELNGLCSYAVNDAYRVLFRFVTDNEVLYYDIGTHEIYR